MTFFHPQSKNHFASGSSGFTMVEILVVITISVFLMTLSIPFIQTAQARIQLQHTLKQLKTDLQITLNHAFSGKSLASFSSISDYSELPAYYGLYFEVDEDFGNPKGYVYAEFGVDQKFESSELYLLHTLEKPLPHSSLFLKEIRLKNQNQESRFAQSVWILLSSPFAKPYLVQVPPGQNQLPDLSQMIKTSELNKSVELDFQYKDDLRHLVTVGFDKQKALLVD